VLFEHACTTSPHLEVSRVVRDGAEQAEVVRGGRRRSFGNPVIGDSSELGAHGDEALVVLDVFVDEALARPDDGASLGKLAVEAVEGGGALADSVAQARSSLRVFGPRSLRSASWLWRSTSGSRSASICTRRRSRASMSGARSGGHISST